MFLSIILWSWLEENQFFGFVLANNRSSQASWETAYKGMYGKFTEMQYNRSTCSTYLCGGDFLCFWGQSLNHPVVRPHHTKKKSMQLSWPTTHPIKNLYFILIIRCKFWRASQTCHIRDDSSKYVVYYLRKLEAKKSHLPRKKKKKTAITLTVYLEIMKKWCKLFLGIEIVLRVGHLIWLDFKEVE